MKVRKSRTLWFSFALVLMGALMELFPYLRDLIDPRYYAVSFVVIGMVVAILRFLTTEPLRGR